MEIAVQLRQLAQERPGAEQYCWRVRYIIFLRNLILHSEILVYCKEKYN